MDKEQAGRLATMREGQIAAERLLSSACNAAADLPRNVRSVEALGYEERLAERVLSQAASAGCYGGLSSFQRSLVRGLIAEALRHAYSAGYDDGGRDMQADCVREAANVARVRGVQS